MNGRPDHDPLGDDLRRVLHGTGSPVTGLDSERVLDRVRSGARRRRARRTAAVTASGTLAAAAVLAVANPFGGPAQVQVAGPSEHVTSTAPRPAVAELEPGTEVDPADVRVRSVTAASRDEFWVLGDASCPEGRCTVVGVTHDGAQSPMEFRAAPGPVEPQEAVLRTTALAEDGWLVSDGSLWSTHDTGRTWQPVETASAAVDDVVASPGSVWVRGENAQGATVVEQSPTDADELVDTELPEEEAPIDVSEVVLPAGEAGGPRFGYLQSGESVVEFVGFDGEPGGWQTYEIPGCEGATSLSGTSEALWSLCDVAGRTVPMVSTDSGVTWELVEVDMGLGDDPRIAAIDGDSAFLSTEAGLFVLAGGEWLHADGPGEDGSVSDYTYVGFNDDRTGFLVDAEGTLSLTDNGGISWEPLDLP